MNHKIFGAFCFNWLKKRVTLNFVRIFSNTEIREVSWPSFPLQYNMIKNTLLHCDYTRKAICIGYDRLEVNSKYQKMLNDIPKVKPFALTPEFHFKSLSIWTSFKDKNNIYTHRDSRTSEQVPAIMAHKFDNKLVPYSFAGQNIDMAKAFVFASYLAIQYLQSKNMK